MVLDWLASRNKPGQAASVPDLIARKQYARAIEILRAQADRSPSDSRIKLQLADVLILAGRGNESVGLLRGIADELAQEGFAAKSIAILKRIQKIEPNSGVEDKLATMIEQKSRNAPLSTRLRTTGSAPSFGMEEIDYEPALREEPAAEPQPAAVEVQREPEFELERTGVAASSGFEAPVLESAVEPEPMIELDDSGDAGRAPGMVSTPLFPDFSKDELLAVMRGLELLNFAAGDIVVAEGEPGDSLFLLTTGRVKAFVKGPTGRYQGVRELYEGDFFGEISILTGRPRTATVTCATNCELLQLDRRALDQITTSHPRVLEVLQGFYDQRANSSAETRIRSGTAVQAS